MSLSEISIPYQENNQHALKEILSEYTWKNLADLNNHLKNHGYQLITNPQFHSPNIYKKRLLINNILQNISIKKVPHGEQSSFITDTCDYFRNLIPGFIDSLKNK